MLVLALAGAEIGSMHDAPPARSARGDGDMQAFMVHHAAKDFRGHLGIVVTPADGKEMVFPALGIARQGMGG
jgi:hypothetical protein